MVEKYKRDGIDIVLGCRKCIYTDEKNKKFIKQNKKYIPIVKRKGKYVIINKKGGGLDIDELKITLKKLNSELKDKINESSGTVTNKLIKIKEELKHELTVNVPLDNIKLNNIIEDYTFKIGIVLGLESSKIKKDKEIQDEKVVIEKTKLKADIKKNDLIKQTRLKATIEKDKEKIQRLNIEIEDNDKNIKLLEIELKNPQAYVFYNDSRRANTAKNIVEMKTRHRQLDSESFLTENRIKENMRKVSEYEFNELEWERTANMEKEQFMKEIDEKVSLSNTLDELYTNYKDKMNREGKYLNNYLIEKNIVPIPLLVDKYHEGEEHYINFMLEMLLNRINDLQERIKIIEKK